MDRILIAILAVLTALGFSGTATTLYLFWLWSGFVKTEWTTLSSVTALAIYWFYGLFGLIVLTGAVLSTVCALAMFWFDMSLQDIQEQAHDTVNDARPEDERTDRVDDSNQNDENVSSITDFDKISHKICEQTGLTEEQAEAYRLQFMERYDRASTAFDSTYETCAGAVTQLRELTDEIPLISIMYHYSDYVRKEIGTYIKAVLSLKELSKLSRQGFGQNPNGAPDFTALQNIDMGALLGGLEVMGMGGNSASTATEAAGSTPAPTSGSRSAAPPFPQMGGFGGFDMSQMAALERNMTPQQKRQAEQAAMNMMQNFDLSQMGDMMSMFGGMGAPQQNTQGLTRAQKRRLKKLQKKGK